MVKYLLAQDVCLPMILRKGKFQRRKVPGLPEDIARDLVVSGSLFMAYTVECYCCIHKPLPQSVVYTIHVYTQTNSEFYVKTAEQQLDRFTAGKSSFARNIQAQTMVDPKKVGTRSLQRCVNCGCTNHYSIISESA